MVEHLRTHPSAAGPRRNNDHRHPITQTKLDALGKFARCPRWRRRWRDMIEVSAFLVVVEDQHRGIVHRRIRRECGHDLAHKILSPGGRPPRMFRVGSILGNDPTNLGQRTIGDIGGKCGGDIAHGGHAAVIEGISRRGVHELDKPPQSVAIIPDLGGPVNLPVHPRCLQALRISRPSQTVRGNGVVENRPALGAVRINHAGEQVEAVGKGRPEERAEIGVTDGVGVGQGIVIGQIGAVAVAHRIHIPTISDQKRQNEVGAVGLEQDGGAVWKQPDVRVIVTAHPLQGAIITVKRMVFLHQDDHVLHVLNGAQIGSHALEAAQCRRQYTGPDQASRIFQESP